jgi:hypothetical protein
MDTSLHPFIERIGRPPELDVSGSHVWPMGCSHRLQYSMDFLDSPENESRPVQRFQHLQESVCLSVEAQAESKLVTPFAPQTQIQQTIVLRSCPGTGGPS